MPAALSRGILPLPPAQTAEVALRSHQLSENDACWLIESCFVRVTVYFFSSESAVYRIYRLICAVDRCSHKLWTVNCNKFWQSKNANNRRRKKGSRKRNRKDLEWVLRDTRNYEGIRRVTVNHHTKDFGELTPWQWLLLHVRAQHSNQHESIDRIILRLEVALSKVWTVKSLNLLSWFFSIDIIYLKVICICEAKVGKLLPSASCCKARCASVERSIWPSCGDRRSCY